MITYIIRECFGVILSKIMFSVLFLFFVPVISFSSIGNHNITVNVGGNFNYNFVDDNGVVPSLWINPNTSDSFIGGGFNLEVGHLYLKQKYIINALDTRVSFGMNFSDIYTVDGRRAILSEGTDIGLNSIYFQVGTTYSIGWVLDKGRVFLDMIGLGVGYINTEEIGKYSSYSETVKSGDIFTLSVNLPLGVQYIFNNNMMIGFRHRLNFAFSAEPTIKKTVSGTDVYYKPSNGGLYGMSRNQSKYLDYNLTFNIGYVFSLL